MTNVDLETFIKQTLMQIHKGIDAAVNQLGNNKSFIISPYGVHTKTDLKTHDEIPKQQTARSQFLYNIREIEFDIAVTASEESKGDTKSNVGASIKVIGATVASNEEKTTQDSHISRIKFSIPVGFSSRFVPE